MNEHEIMNIVYHFGIKLTKSKFDMYIPKIRDYFAKYILENKSGSTIENVLKYEITRNDIIQSTVYYIIKNKNVRSKSAIDDYLTIINRFFEEAVFSQFPNQNLISVKPFTNLYKEVELLLDSMGVVLEERQSNPEINEDQSNFILQYMRADKDKSFITIQVQIMIKLFLLYGFSFDRLRDLQIGNYSVEERKLEINYQENRRSSLLLEVPFNLHKEIEIYLKIRSLKQFDNKSFFVNSKGNSITHSFPAYYLNLIKDEYLFLNEGEYEIRNPFTPTGISKYAVINMILKGVNQSVIIDLTGFKMETYMYCQQKVDELKELNRNRYINHMIRGIATFEEI